jgi:opacity protein-like surface antigen
MKKAFSIIVVLFMLLMIPVISFSAPTGPYVSSHAGVSFLTESDIAGPGGAGTIEFDPGFAVGGAGGYNFGMFRIEGEIGYQRNEMDRASICSTGYGCVSGSISGNMSALSGLGNVYLDFVNSSPFTPYISGGMGIAYVNAEIDEGDETASENDTVFAYQVGAGVGFSINPNMIIDLKYRYFATSDIDVGDGNATVASHNVYIGFRYTF